jgi:flagellar motility protein MotE (MotC chaperone)
MTGWVRDFRLLPVVLVATISLFALKTFGLVFDGGFTLGERLGSDSTLTVTTVPVAANKELRSPSQPLDIGKPLPPRRSWMQEVYNYPDITGSVAASKPAEKKAAEEAEAKKEQPKDAAKDPPKDPPPDKAAGGQVIALEQPRPTSAGERALLERLQARRQELDARARELDMREGMLKAAEKKVETETAANKADPKAGPAAQRKAETENARFKAVVTMYETMKPKDAAKIFDRLDIKVLLDMASQIKPQAMAAIMANMSPEVAERLTMEMAAKDGADRTLNPANLPKIEGKPGGG